MSVSEDLKNFVILGKLGEGGFGKVLLMRELFSEKLVAMKIQSKEALCRSTTNIDGLRHERKLLEELRGNPFFTQLIFALNGQSSLYIGLEFCAGGSLFDVQRRQKHQRFPEGTVRFYAAELTVALEELHRRGIIHADLKRENVLIDASGHIQVADFGLSVSLMDHEKTSGIRGTPGYVSILNTNIFGLYI